MQSTKPSSSLFENLFVFDMANNHEGSVELGSQIIDAMGGIAETYSLNAGVKLQYRDLDTFIHPDFRARKDVKHIPRFLQNRLSWEDFGQFVARVRQRGMRIIVTPFDEASVQRCIEHEVEILKVASCSANDWPLLAAVAAAGKPMIVSTAGLSLSQIDAVVSFLQHRGVTFALMHCVALYPTPSEQAQMNFMERLARRYSDIPVGYSGHEEPDNLDVVRVAVSKGARLLERHVGVPTAERALNAYSMNPEQTAAWVEAALATRAIAGSTERLVPEEELGSLRSLQRGVYARGKIVKGQEIRRENVFFAMPLQEGQLTSGEFGRYRTRYVASQEYASGEAIAEEPQQDAISEMRSIVHDAKGILHEAGVRLNSTAEIELSHHHGLGKFREIGALIVNVINREYCKKLIVMLPGQRHPTHRHEVKEETFHLLWGDLTVTMNGQPAALRPGDTLLVERGVWHSFATQRGCVVEEVSTTHVKGDSYYEEAAISALDPTERKTVLEDW